MINVRKLKKLNKQVRKFQKEISKKREKENKVIFS